MAKNHRKDVPVSVADNGRTLLTAAIDQTQPPTDVSFDSTDWDVVFDVVNLLVGDTLFVTIGGSGAMTADAVMVERISSLKQSEMSVTADANPIKSGGTFDFGSTNVGTPLQQVFTIRNEGTDLLSVHDIGVPNGFTLVTEASTEPLATGEIATFKVAFDATTGGVSSGVVGVNISGSSGFCVFLLVERVDLKSEEFLVAISVGLSLHRLDLVISPLKWPGRDGVVIPVQ